MKIPNKIKTNIEPEKPPTTKARFVAWRDGKYLGGSETVKAARRFYGWDR